jgi:hypothetical protein
MAESDARVVDVGQHLGDRVAGHVDPAVAEASGRCGRGVRHVRVSPHPARHHACAEGAHHLRAIECR